MGDRMIKIGAAVKRMCGARSVADSCQLRRLSQNPERKRVGRQAAPEGWAKKKPKKW